MRGEIQVKSKRIISVVASLFFVLGQVSVFAEPQPKELQGELIQVNTQQIQLENQQYQLQYQQVQTKNQSGQPQNKQVHLASKNDTATKASKTLGNSVIAYASKFMGTPYLWGGTNPKSGFDCSGFTQYVYAHFGISLGRTTWDQIQNGVSVPKSQLQPGDLVFFGKGDSPTHVGMYVGNSSYINAPQTGDVVRIGSINRKDYIAARRVK